MNNNKPYIIGVAGGSGSGKTFFLKCFLHHFNTEEVCLISQDDYYKPIGEQKVDENGWVNFDLPEGINDTKLLEDLKLLIDGRQFQEKNILLILMRKVRLMNIRVHDYNCRGIICIPLSEHHNIRPEKFMDADEEITLNRRISRDEIDRGIPVIWLCTNGLTTLCLLTNNFCFLTRNLVRKSSLTINMWRKIL